MSESRAGPPPVSDGSEEGEPSPDRKHGAWRFAAELPILVAIALVITLVLKAFVVQAFYIEQQSMLPTLNPGNRVLVSKFHYRFGEPSRGDVVIFRDPRDPCDQPNELPECHPGLGKRIATWIAGTFGLPTGKEDLVKRIVGLPGETVAIHNGEVYVCDEPGCEPLNAELEPEDGHIVRFPHDADGGPQTDDSEEAAVTIPKDEYLVMGDNRAQSADSRVFGTVPREDFVGKVFVLIWPPSRFRGL
ncbi:MAG: signal peptidase I [Actinomycetota bacterium]